MKRYLSGLAIVCVAGAAWAGAAWAGEASPADGEVDRVEVCAGGLDLSSQPTIDRHFGGVVRLPWGLPRSQAWVVVQAADLRTQATGGKAVWRLIQDGPGEDFALHSDEVLLASCGAGQQGSLTHWNWRKPTGGLGVVWSQLGTGPAAVDAVAGALHGLEGVDPE